MRAHLGWQRKRVVRYERPKLAYYQPHLSEAPLIALSDIKILVSRIGTFSRPRTSLAYFLNKLLCGCFTSVSSAASTLFSASTASLTGFRDSLTGLLASKMRSSSSRVRFLVSGMRNCGKAKVSQCRSG